MTTCDLCDLPTPDPPVTRGDTEGEFCCRGCLEVAGRLDADADRDRETIRGALEGEGGESPPGDGETAFLSVDGMHCATCEAFVEGRAVATEGIYDAEASYAAEVVKLRYDPGRVDEADLPDAVGGLGYTARPVDEGADRKTSPPWRLLVGGFLAMPVMVWYLVVLYPRYLGVAPESPAWSGAVGPASMLNLWLLATVVLGYTGYPILRGAYVSLRAGRPNMDLLVALAAVNAYLYSTATAALGGTEVYFDIVVVIVLAVTLGNHYEERIKRRASAAFADIAAERVEEARRRVRGETETVPVETLDGGDEVVVRPGERIPADGEVAEGTAAVDESLLTGESRPARRGPGDEVLGGTVVADDALVVEVGEDAESTADRLTALLWEVQSATPGVQRLADRIAAVFVPVVLGIAVLAAAWGLYRGVGVVDALLAALAVLVVSCPCALGIATPLVVASGVRAGLEAGIAVTDASVFETAPAADVVAFDKTGTLTTGEMRVIDPAGEEAMELAAAVEAYASHPVADAITAHTPPPDPPVSGFTRHPGRGASARVGDREVIVGHPDLFRDRGWSVPADCEERVEAARESGGVPVVVGWEGRARSVCVASDEPREGWRGAVSDLAADREVVVITGDDAAPARRFREHPGVDRVFVGVPPEAKAEVVERLRREGAVAMVGDGTNDAPALATADLGIAMGSGTAVAADAAEAVIRSDDLAGVPATFEVVGAARRRIRENLGWAFCYNAIAVPVAAAGLLNPLVAAVAMAASSLLVVANSTRPFHDGESRPAGSSSESPVPT